MTICVQHSKFSPDRREKRFFLFLKKTFGWRAGNQVNTKHDVELQKNEIQIDIIF
jgi:hypothetical protein